jgi:hypothetical protein
LKALRLYRRLLHASLSPAPSSRLHCEHHEDEASNQGCEDRAGRSIALLQRDETAGQCSFESISVRLCNYTGNKLCAVMAVGVMDDKDKDKDKDK